MKKIMIVFAGMALMFVLMGCAVPDTGGMVIIINQRAHRMVLDEDGVLWAWGHNVYGELGDGTNICRDMPIEIMQNVADVQSIDTYRAGRFIGSVPVPDEWGRPNVRTFVITADGVLYGWGTNEYGQLGDGTKYNSNTPMRIMENVAAVYPAQYNTFAIDENGTLYAWGRNGGFRGAHILGDGTMLDRLQPYAIMDNVASVHLDYWGHANFLITIDGSLYGWGTNHYGEIGDGTTEGSSYPIRVMDNVSTVFTGSFATAYAITKDAALYAWGGYLGEDYQDRFGRGKVPVRIMEDVRYFHMASSLVLLEDNSLWAFSTFWTDPILPHKIMDSVNSFAVGPFGWGNIRVYAISTDSQLLTWIKPMMSERQGNNVEDDSSASSPRVILNSIASIHPGEIWEYGDKEENEEYRQMLDIMTMFGVEFPDSTEAGSYVLSTDGKLWRIGNHQPFVVLDSVLRFYDSPTQVYMALQENGSLWIWRNNNMFLHESDKTPDEPTIIMEGIFEPN